MAVAENKQLVDYFKELKINGYKGKEEVAVIEFIQKRIDKFDWGKDISTIASVTGRAYRTAWQCDKVAFLDKLENYVLVDFTSLVECDDDVYDDYLRCQAIFLKHYGAFASFTEDSVYTNKLKDFCETLGLAE